MHSNRAITSVMRGTIPFAFQLPPYTYICESKLIFWTCQTFARKPPGGGGGLRTPSRATVHNLLPPLVFPIALIQASVHTLAVCNIGQLLRIPSGNLLAQPHAADLFASIGSHPTHAPAHFAVEVSIGHPHSQLGASLGMVRTEAHTVEVDRVLALLLVGSLVSEDGTDGTHRRHWIIRKKCLDLSLGVSHFCLAWLVVCLHIHM